MPYSSVQISDLDGTFLGYAILKNDVNKLEGTNLYSEEEHDIKELEAQLKRLNYNEALKAAWPTPVDPDVLEVLADDLFFPIEYTSEFVIVGVAKEGYWRGEHYVDPVPRYDFRNVPVSPAENANRVKQAQERVARQRLGLL